MDCGGKQLNTQKGDETRSSKLIFPSAKRDYAVAKRP